MHSETTRINALICYFFLGPFILLSREGTPLADPFVKGHAKKSSIFLVIFAIIIAIFMQLKPFLTFSILNFSIYYILFAGIIFLFFGIMLFGAFQAFRGIEAQKVWNFKNLSSSFYDNREYAEEEKIRITLAFVPLLGIFLSAKYSEKDILLGRKIGNFFLFLLILSGVLYGSVSIIGFIIILTYIGIIVTTGVLLFHQGKLLQLPFYNFIPTYTQIESYIGATLITGKEFLFIAFWRKQQSNFQENYQKIFEKNSTIIQAKESFWTHPAIIAIPIINIITIPSFFQKKYHEYQWNIAEWFFLTILSILWFLFVKNIFILYLLIFPIITLLAFSKKNINIRAPLTSIIRNIFIMFYQTQHKIQEMQKNEIIETYNFTNNNPENKNH